MINCDKLVIIWLLPGYNILQPRFERDMMGPCEAKIMGRT